ncbi:MAG: hypothetical protein K0M49_02470 [Arenimonas sp.]|nr:hypothetical protein [Rhizobium sp.]MBW8444472.1 hypothetical protein [Arenimonas sp.]
MSKLVTLTIASAKPMRCGADYWWSCILDITREAPCFSYAELDGLSDPYHERYLGQFLRRLEKTGFIAKFAAGSRNYILVKRQSQVPSLGHDARESQRGQRLQNMWNVMRRRRSGFTVDELALDASVDDLVVARNTAKQYCLLLARAGMLAVQAPGKRGEGRNIYVLRGSANTGPKAPRKMKATMVYDPNREIIVGDVVAEEDRT